jgi:deazaflavin-dependent oxidoreductase (nitroreductase family)
MVGPVDADSLSRHVTETYAAAMGNFSFKQKPSGLFKWLLHAPTWLYRWHLGFLMGSRFVMIEHLGRTSGKLYRTVLEVAGRYPEEIQWIVTSGTGPKADWYRNLRVGTLQAIWSGSKRSEATVRFLGAEEAASVFHDYELNHPKTAANLMNSMGVSYDGTKEDRVEMMRSIPMVSFTPT